LNLRQEEIQIQSDYLFESKGLGADYYGYHNINHELEVTFGTLLASKLGGEQRAFMMANVLKHCKVIIVGSKEPQIVKDAKMIPTSTMNEAFKIVQNDLGKNLDVILIPNAMMTLPIIK